MMEGVYWSDSAEATREMGVMLGEGLRAGDVVALEGVMGAGKTCFVTGLVAALGSREVVGSPTFGLVREYREGRLPVAHFDFYRIKSDRELWELGWDDYLDGTNVVVVEWASLFPEVIPTGTTWIYLENESETARQVRVGRLRT